jgi:hypothetical protein
MKLLFWACTLGLGVMLLAGTGNALDQPTKPLDDKAKKDGEQQRKFGFVCTIAVKEEIHRELSDDHQRDRVRGTPCMVFQVELKEGIPYQIELKALGYFKTRPDVYLRLEDEMGRHLDSNDDGGVGVNSHIDFKCPKNGWYRIIATTYSGDSGFFTLKVDETPRVDTR